MTLVNIEPAPGSDPHEMSDRRYSRRAQRRSRVMRVAGVTALLVPVAIVEIWRGSFSDEALGSLTLVIGGIIPSLAGIATLATLVGLVLVVAAPIVGAWPRQKGWTILMRVISVITIGFVATQALYFWLLIAAWQPHFEVIGEMSDTGCRVIAAQASSGLHNRDSFVGVLPASSTNVDWLVRDVSANVGTFDPFSDIEVTWRRDHGELSVEQPPPGTETIDALAFEC